MLEKTGFACGTCPMESQKFSELPKFYVLKWHFKTCRALEDVCF